MNNETFQLTRFQNLALRKNYYKNHFKKLKTWKIIKIYCENFTRVLGSKNAEDREKKQGISKCYYVHYFSSK